MESGREAKLTLKNNNNNATIDAAFSIFLGLLMCSTLFQQSSVRLTRAFPIGSQSYSSIKAINVAKNQWLKRATKHIPPCVNGADTAARLMLSLQPNIPFVSESCRGEHKNKKCLDGETQGEVRSVCQKRVCVCVRVCGCVITAATRDHFKPNLIDDLKSVGSCCNNSI